jgi:hypothetical protein
MNNKLAFPTKQSGRDVGMTLRDYFAAEAMQGLLGKDLSPRMIPEHAYRIADAMIKERNVANKSKSTPKTLKPKPKPELKLALEPKPKPKLKRKPNMSNPNNWRVGDLIECINAERLKLVQGQLYTIKKIKSFGICVDTNRHGIYFVHRFRWHSRPAENQNSET